MPKKVSVKPILELRAAGISMRKIESLMHVSRHTISAIYKAADVHSDYSAQVDQSFRLC